MDFLDSLMGNTKQKEEYEDFVRRYENGPPEEGYSDDEVVNRYRQVASNASPDVYMESAREAFERLSPQQRMQFAQYLQQQAGQRHMNVPELDRPGTDERFQDPGFLANVVSGMDRQQPGILSQLFGGGQGDQGGGMLSSPIAKAALAGIAAIAFRKMTGR